ncbi:MAG: ATP-NAD kinase family protein, partial [Armatimonadetes bacterium]|nr:ATP-NAD kinase family protein [Armatimonadota bacterium]
VVTPPEKMGEDEARDAGFVPVVVGSIPRGGTTAADTERLARVMRDLQVDLLLFAGGDGTARDICGAVGTALPALGVPAGVKMHSAVFATSPRAAADVAVAHLQTEAPNCRDSEVMDVDEEAVRRDVVSARLYGFLSVPYAEGLVQDVKVASAGEERSLSGIAADIVERMQDDCPYILGPGTTVRAIAQKLGLQKTLMGVDVVYRNALVGIDVNEAHLLRLLDGMRAKIVVAPIGGQGYVFGRGNQQISAEVLRRAGRDNVIVVATPGKLASLRGAPLRVDSGDAAVDDMLRGFIRVVTGYRSEVVCRIGS